VPLWTASTGSGDTEAEWSSIGKEIAEHTKRWVEVLADFVASARKRLDKLNRERAERAERARTPSPVHEIKVKMDWDKLIKSIKS
jgi:hypothetical protein